MASESHGGESLGDEDLPERLGLLVTDTKRTNVSFDSLEADSPSKAGMLRVDSVLIGVFKRKRMKRI